MGGLMGGMTFAEPRWLWGIAALFPITATLFYLLRSKRRQIEKWISPGLLKIVFRGWEPSLQRRKLRVVVVAAVLLLLALARPQWGEKDDPTNLQSLDLVLLLDVSRSMQTEDVIPNRLKMAKHAAENLLGLLPADRFGLIVFAANASVLSPLTTDHAYVREILDSIDPLEFSQGSDIGNALLMARDVLDRGAEDPKGKAVILLSDGEDLESGYVSSIDKMKSAQIPVYALGLGTTKGSPIADRDASGRLLGYHKDQDGQTVLSKLELASLEQIASGTGGKAFALSRTESEVQDLYQELRKLQRGEGVGENLRSKVERYQIPLGLGLMLLAWELMIPARAAVAFVGLFLGVTFGGARAQAQSLEAYRENKKGLEALGKNDLDSAKTHFGAAQSLDPESPELMYNEGLSKLGSGDTKGAQDSFSHARQGARNRNDSSLEAKSAYNLGATQEKAGNIDEAVRSYSQGIEASRRAQDTKLEQELRRKIELIQIQQQSGGGSQNSENQNKPDQQEQQNQDQSKSENSPNSMPQKSQRFRSDNLSQDEAERIMKELGRREKDIGKKLRKRKNQADGQNQDKDQNQKDW